MTRLACILLAAMAVASMATGCRNTTVPTNGPTATSGTCRSDAYRGCPADAGPVTTTTETSTYGLADGAPALITFTDTGSEQRWTMSSIGTVNESHTVSVPGWCDANGKPDPNGTSECHERAQRSGLRWTVNVEQVAGVGTYDEGQVAYLSDVGKAWGKLASGTLGAGTLQPGQSVIGVLEVIGGDNEGAPPAGTVALYNAGKDSLIASWAFAGGGPP